MERKPMIPERVRLLFQANPGLYQKMREHFIKQMHEEILAHQLRAEKATEATSKLQSSLKVTQLIESSGLPVNVRNTLLKRCEGRTPEDVISLIETTKRALHRNPEKVMENKYNTILSDDQVSTIYARLAQRK